MARRRTHAERVVEVSGEATVVVVADTHSRPHERAADHVTALEPDAILHAGDIGARQVVEDLDVIAPTIAVRGNIDDLELPDDVLIRFVVDGDELVRVLLTHIAVHGPRLRKDARTRAERHDARIVVCGHSHVPLVASERGRTVFNPGSIGPRRFSLPITFGVMRISPEGIRLSHVDCVTGERWLPPAA